MKNRDNFSELSESASSAAHEMMHVRLSLAILSCNNIDSSGGIVGLREWELQELKQTKSDALKVENYSLVNKLNIEISNRERWVKEIIKQSK
ncbi:MAG: hypothetical protein V3W20_08185 [Candidatus Neomarinimicrobiota bacterium]